MSSSARQMQRQAAKVARNDARKLFKEALQMGERMEREMKQTVSSMNFARRFIAAIQIIFKMWK